MYIRVIEQDNCVFNFLHLSFKKTTVHDHKKVFIELLQQTNSWLSNKELNTSPPLQLVWGTLNAYTSSYGKMETIQI